ncbi:DUF6636 domain-containing protein [Mumia sp. DW29H23]|uniref:DUF6636 domain-containing protein n=1 Tax=Mumia sp. DW29H23 TaxID=3421241 RepID=UPI003D690A12
MHRPRSLVLAHVAVIAGLALAGCGSASDLTTAEASPTPPPPTSSPRTAQLPLDDVDTDLPDVGDPMRAFQSPTGNIVCRLGEDGARCDILDFAFEPPPKPDGCGEDWGGTLVVDASGGYFSCGAPSLAGKSPELAYGHSTVVGDYGCTSQRTGVTCLHTESKHGFTVSRERTGTF